MYLVHLWLVEITCRMECISAAAKWLPSRQMRPIKRSGDPDVPNYRSDWRIEKFSCPSHCPNFWLSKYTVSVSTFLCRTAQNYFLLAAALVHAGCDVSEWHKLAIAIVTLVFPEPGDCWGMDDSKAASVDRSVTGPTTVTTNLEFPIRLLPSAFIFCCHLPMHFPTNTRHNITSKDKFGTRTPNKLTPDESLANLIFDAAAAVAVFDTGSEAFFYLDSPHHTTVHPLRPFRLKLYQWQM